MLGLLLLVFNAVKEFRSGRGLEATGEGGGVMAGPGYRKGRRDG